MKSIILIAILTCSHPIIAYSTESATPEEIYDGVLRGAEILQALGEEGLSAFNDPKGEFSWKDTYVQVYKCKAQQIVGHINPNLLAWMPEKFASIEDKKGNKITALICDAARKPNGAWVEYFWPKAGESEASRKITFAIQVPGQPYQVSAGIYDESISLEQLNSM